jgi:hypothetical protein
LAGVGVSEEFFMTGIANNFYSQVPLVQAAVWAPVTPSNTVDLPVPTTFPAGLIATNICKGLYIDGAGALKFLPANNDDSNPITINVAAGEFIGGFFRRVFQTGTTATGISALY